MRSEPPGKTAPVRAGGAGGRGSKILICLLLLGVLALLRQGLELLNAGVPALREQTGLIAARGIDPAALFYTESPLALAAEKRVRRGIALAKSASGAESSAEHAVKKSRRQ